MPKSVCTDRIVGTLQAKDVESLYSKKQQDIRNNRNSFYFGESEVKVLMKLWKHNEGRALDNFKIKLLERRVR